MVIGGLTTNALLYLNNVSVTFDGFRALNNLSLSIDHAEMRAIIGPNGAGKTTMMDVITGKTRPTSGTAFFGQTMDLSRMSEHQIAHAGIGRKFQRPTIFEQHTVFENLELAMKTDKRVRPTLFARLSSEALGKIDEILRLIRLNGSERRLAGLLSALSFFRLATRRKRLQPIRIRGGPTTHANYVRSFDERDCETSLSSSTPNVSTLFPTQST